MLSSAQPAITNTTLERGSLRGDLNLSDAHARQPLTPAQQTIVSQLPKLFSEAYAEKYFDLEAHFVDKFFTLAGQSRPYPYERYLLSYSASCAVTMLASYCCRSGKSVALIEPIFDNISSILKREGVVLRVLDEAMLLSDDVVDELRYITTDIIWITTPNNPTGHYLAREQFTRLIEFCLKYNKTLIVDFCFRFFCKNMYMWDQYDLLKASGVSFVMIEDTGKTWPTAEMKIGMVVCSDDLFHEMYRLHDDLLQNISPFHLRVLTEFVHETQQHGREASIFHYIDINRGIVRRHCATSVLELTSATENVTVEWIKIKGNFTGHDLHSALAKRGVHILPGSKFFWNAPVKGQQFIRIALARPPEVLYQGAPLIAKVATELAEETAGK